VRGFILCHDDEGDDVVIPFTANTPEELAVAITTAAYTGLTIYRVEGGSKE
jgi:hypothetical protein